MLPRPSPHPNLMYAAGSGQLVLTPEAEERLIRINSERAKVYRKDIADGTIKPYVHIDARAVRKSGKKINPRRRARLSQRSS